MSSPIKIVPPDSSAEPRYRIGAVARATGISPDTLRVWERRYGGLVPARSDAGGRLYSDTDIARLRLIRELLDRGHAIGRLANLADDELREILVKHDTAPVGAAKVDLSTDLKPVKEKFLVAVSQLDIATAQQILAHASLLLPRRDLVVEFLHPILFEVGERWAQGRLRVAHEHVASGLIRSLLGGLLATAPLRTMGPKMIATTPAGELHEFGALLMSLLATSYGWNVLYLGPNLPAEEIVETTLRSGATVVALSMVTQESPDATADLQTLVHDLPASVELVVGGRASQRYPFLLDRATFFNDLTQFETWMTQKASVFARAGG